MSIEPEWQIEEPHNIRKIFKKLGQPEKKQHLEAIRTLTQSDDPKAHGDYKKSLGYFTYDISSSFRITFDIDYQKRIIYILSIGDHKQTYGRNKHS